MPSGMDPAAVTANMSARRLKRSVKEQDVSITSGSYPERAEAVDADGDAELFGQGQRDGGPLNRLSWRFPCLAIQALEEPPPPGADTHTDPPIETFERIWGARGSQGGKNPWNGKPARPRGA